MAAPLRFWVLTTAGPASVQPISRMIEAFSRRSGVPVELRAIPWGRGWRALTRAIKRRDLPDVMHIGSTWIATLAHLDLLAEAPRGVWTQPTVAPWVDEAALAGGVAWAVPWTVECNVLIGRTDLLEAAGVAPEEFSDWDGFLQVCRRLDGMGRSGDGPLKGILPVAVHSRPDSVTLHWATPWLWSGGWRLDRETLVHGVVLRDESAEPGLQFIAELFKTSPLLPEMADTSSFRVALDFFEAGRYVFYSSHSVHFFRPLVQAGPGERPSRWPMAMFPLPRGPAGSLTRGGGSFLAVSRTSKQPAVAWELVRFLTEDQQLTELALVTGELPALQGTFWSQYAHHPAHREVLQMLRNARAYPPHPLWRTVESLLVNGIGEICWRFARGQGYDAALQSLTAQIDQRIQNLLRLGWEVSA
ncbi:MAG: extracellular solute-binding protein [Bacillota bacterium]|nr:hypothetical protein [Bacillota bacterium]